MIRVQLKFRLSTHNNIFICINKIHIEFYCILSSNNFQSIKFFNKNSSFNLFIFRILFFFSINKIRVKIEKQLEYILWSLVEMNEINNTNFNRQTTILIE